MSSPKISQIGAKIIQPGHRNFGTANRQRAAPINHARTGTEPSKVPTQNRSVPQNAVAHKPVPNQAAPAQSRLAPRRRFGFVFGRDGAGGTRDKGSQRVPGCVAGGLSTQLIETEGRKRESIPINLNVYDQVDHLPAGRRSFARPLTPATQKSVPKRAHEMNEVIATTPTCSTMPLPNLVISTEA